MSIPENARISTDNNSRISLFETKTSHVVFIGPKKKIEVKSLSIKTKKDSLLKNLFRKKININRPTSVAGVRASKKGENSVIWDEGDSDTIDRTSEWQLYKTRDYKKILDLTKDAEDLDGVFLRSMSLYMIHGVKESSKISIGLENYISQSSEPKLKTQSLETLAFINFETGKYDRAFEYIKKATKYKRSSDISELSYYLLVSTYYYTGNQKESRKYFNKMKNYYPDSVLLKKLREFN